MGSRLTEYPQGLASALAEPPMVRACDIRMQAAYRRARVISPVDTGLYLSRHRVVSGVRNGKAFARLINDARNPLTGYPYCLALEYGTRYMKRMRILGRAADALRQ